MQNIPKLIDVKTQPDYYLILIFNNGEQRLYDFKPNLTHPYYKPLASYSLFQQVTVTAGEIEWSSGQDFCPHTLYENSLPYTEKAV